MARLGLRVSNFLLVLRAQEVYGVFFGKVPDFRGVERQWWKPKCYQLSNIKNREQTCGCQGGGGGLDWEFGVMQAITYRTDKQQGPTVAHRELYSISWDKP